MTELQKGELREILGAIREVGATLERRRARTYGAVMIMWGLIAGAIFAFYQYIHLDEAHYHETYGHGIDWLWLAPCALGAIVTAFIGARVGRMDQGDQERRTLLRFLLVMLPPAALTVWLIAAYRNYEYIPGLWIVFLALVLHVFPRPARRFHAVPRYALSLLALVGGAWLLAFPNDWGDGIAALYFGVGQAGLGAMKYCTCE